MIRPNYSMGTKNEAFGPGGIQNAITETLVRTEGPIDAKLIDKSINENGIYSASAEGVDGFKKVTVDVPNTYFLSDEGKVVSGGSLVTQTSSTITENGVVDTTLIDSVTVDVNVPAPSPISLQSNDVTIYDYDGTIIASYTAAEFAELSAYPAQPTHEHLTGQGYTYNLSDAKTYVASYGGLDIGAQYTVTDGKTRIYVHLEEGTLTPTLTFKLRGGAVINWGDDSEDTTLPSSGVRVVSSKHEYSTQGRYVISIEVVGERSVIEFQDSTNQGSMLINKDGTFSNSYAASIYKVEIGSTMYQSTIQSDAFKGCLGLETVLISTTVTKLGYSCFAECNSLTFICLPSSIVYESDTPSYVFAGCSSLRSICIPPSINAFGDAWFSGCLSLRSICLPLNFEDLDGTFYGCNALNSIILPDNDTILTIDIYAFRECYSLASITIPSVTTFIGEMAFYECRGLNFIKFLPSSPPEADVDAFENISSSCIIYVPTGTLEAYTSAENYPDPNTYTYVEY